MQSGGRACIWLARARNVVAHAVSEQVEGRETIVVDAHQGECCSCGGGNRFENAQEGKKSRQMPHCDLARAENRGTRADLWIWVVRTF